MYYVMRASAPSLHRESTDSLIRAHESLVLLTNIIYAENCKMLSCRDTQNFIYLNSYEAGIDGLIGHHSLKFLIFTE